MIAILRFQAKAEQRPEQSRPQAAGAGAGTGAGAGASASASKRKRENMCESDISVPLTPPRPQHIIHFQPLSPEISSSYSPNVVRRMLTDTCFRCHQQGHWALHCPLNSPTVKSQTPIVDDSGITNIHCRCGHGFCEIKTATNQLNCGRKYYVCPIKRGKKCTGFVNWCDAPIDESYLHPPLYKYPECRCGAGVCRRELEKTFPNVGRYYFACPVAKGHGSCSFHLWEDTLLDTTSVVPVQQSSQRSLHFNWEDHHGDETNRCEFGMGGDLQVESFKRMKIVNDSQCSPIIAVSELPEEVTVLKAVPMERGDYDEAAALSTSKDADFPEFEVVDDLLDLDMTNSVSWDSIEEEARLLSHISMHCRSRSQQREVGRQIPTIADAPFGVFPSFNAIFVPKHESIRDDPCSESKQLVISNSSQPVQLSTGCHTEFSTDVVSPNISPGSKRKPMSKAQRQRQMVFCGQQQLLLDLETLNPLDHESMREAAEATFDVLNSLSVDYKQFSEHVWEFINCASSLAKIQNSMENYLSPQEHVQRYKEEKVRLASICDNHFKTKASVKVSHQLSQSLREEASRLKAMLLQIENQLATCESETLMIETNLGEIERKMLEAERSFNVAAEEAEMARKLNEEREAKQSAAITALEKAKLQL